MSNLFRHIPSVDQLLSGLAEHPDIQVLPRPLVKEHVNGYLDFLREGIKSGSIESPEQLDISSLLPGLVLYVLDKSRPHFRRVVNATGVVVHTNMGRSLLAEEAVQAVAHACRNYSNLEFDLNTGERGSRYSHVEEIICKLTGAEAALVVNNNASAVLITLDTLAKGREVIVSRGQLVEIGGSFRIPDVMAKSGATLKEVGTTNRTHPKDYEQAITEETGALMKVHTSNYRIVGFTKDVTVAELSAIAMRHGLPLIEDLGSGSIFDLSATRLINEPLVQDVVAQGADVVTFSGDKVLGGPQAGVIVGRKKYIDTIKKNPLNRAIRIDKMTLAALEATLRLYLDPEQAAKKVPTLAMITATESELKVKANRLARNLRKRFTGKLEIGLVRGASRVGGGSFPEQDLPTWLVSLVPVDKMLTIEELRDRLLNTDPPMVGRIENDAFCLDPRTLAEDEMKKLAADCLNQALSK